MVMTHDPKCSYAIGHYNRLVGHKWIGSGVMCVDISERNKSNFYCYKKGAIFIDSHLNKLDLACLNLWNYLLGKI